MFEQIEGNRRRYVACQLRNSEKGKGWRARDIEKCTRGRTNHSRWSDDRLWKDVAGRARNELERLASGRRQRGRLETHLARTTDCQSDNINNRRRRRRVARIAVVTVADELQRQVERAHERFEDRDDMFDSLVDRAQEVDSVVDGRFSPFRDRVHLDAALDEVDRLRRRQEGGDNPVFLSELKCERWPALGFLEKPSTEVGRHRRSKLSPALEIAKIRALWGELRRKRLPLKLGD